MLPFQPPPPPVLATLSADTELLYDVWNTYTARIIWNVYECTLDARLGRIPMHSVPSLCLFARIPVPAVVGAHSRIVDTDDYRTSGLLYVEKSLWAYVHIRINNEYTFAKVIMQTQTSRELNVAILRECSRVYALRSATRRDLDSTRRVAAPPKIQRLKTDEI